MNIKNLGNANKSKSNKQSIFTIVFKDIFFILLKYIPELVFSAGELCQNSGSESVLVILTADHHTGADIQLLHLRPAVKSNMVSGYETCSLIFKTDFVL